MPGSDDEYVEHPIASEYRLEARAVLAGLLADDAREFDLDDVDDVAALVDFAMYEGMVTWSAAFIDYIISDGTGTPFAKLAEMQAQSIVVDFLEWMHYIADVNEAMDAPEDERSALMHEHAARRLDRAKMYARPTPKESDDEH